MNIEYFSTKTNINNSTSFDLINKKLPDEILLIVFNILINTNYTSSTTLMNLHLVCKRWNGVASDNFIYRQLRKSIDKTLISNFHLNTSRKNFPSNLSRNKFLEARQNLNFPNEKAFFLSITHAAIKFNKFMQRFKENLEADALSKSLSRIEIKRQEYLRLLQALTIELEEMNLEKEFQKPLVDDKEIVDLFEWFIDLNTEIVLINGIIPAITDGYENFKKVIEYNRSLAQKEEVKENRSWNCTIF